MIRFRIHINNEIRTVDLNDIAYFYSQEHDSFLVTTGGVKYFVNMTLNSIYNLVKHSDFFRVHRLIIVNYKAITKIVQVKNGVHQRLKISVVPDYTGELLVARDKTVDFKNWLGYPKAEL